MHLRACRCPGRGPQQRSGKRRGADRSSRLANWQRSDVSRRRERRKERRPRRRHHERRQGPRKRDLSRRCARGPTWDARSLHAISAVLQAQRHHSPAAQLLDPREQSTAAILRCCFRAKPIKRRQLKPTVRFDNGRQRERRIGGKREGHLGFRTSRCASPPLAPRAGESGPTPPLSPGSVVRSRGRCWRL